MPQIMLCKLCTGDFGDDPDGERRRRTPRLGLAAKAGRTVPASGTAAPTALLRVTSPAAREARSGPGSEWLPWTGAALGRPDLVARRAGLGHAVGPRHCDWQARPGPGPARPGRTQSLVATESVAAAAAAAATSERGSDS